jgi:hypothetical protein
VNPASSQPRLFIGSSTESLGVAYAIQENLEFDAECTVWTQGIFRPTRQIVAELQNVLQRTDFGVFICTPDDLARMRGTEHQIVRDNVMFELGLFMGHLGTHRCFLVTPREASDLHLPSDLLGVQPLTFKASRSDNNLIAALGSACNAIRREMRSRAMQPVETWTGGGPLRRETNGQKLQRLIEAWNGATLANDRAVLRNGVPACIADDEDGTATPALTRIFVFLNSVADIVLNDPELEDDAKPVFAAAVASVWDVSFTYFSSPVGSAREFWGEDPPPIAQLAARWRADS